MEYNARVRTPILQQARGREEHEDLRYPSEFPRHVIVPAEIGSYKSIEHRLKNWGQYDRPRFNPHDIYHPRWREFQLRTAHERQVPYYPIESFFQAGWYVGVLFDDVFEVDWDFSEAACDWWLRQHGQIEIPPYIGWIMDRRRMCA